MLMQQSSLQSGLCDKEVGLLKVQSRAMLLNWGNTKDKQQLQLESNLKPELLESKPLVSSWTQEDVQTFLSVQGIHPDQLTVYQKAFKDHKVDGQKLLTLDDKYLREQMKLYVPGWRALVLKAISMLKSSSSSKSTGIPHQRSQCPETAQEVAGKLKEVIM